MHWRQAYVTLLAPLPLSTEDPQLLILSLNNLIPHASVAEISSLTRTV